jgi:hypothetical protein
VNMSRFVRHFLLQLSCSEVSPMFLVAKEDVDHVLALVLCSTPYH